MSLHIPAVVVNCDKCTRSLTFATWDTKAEIVERLQKMGWLLRFEPATNPKSEAPPPKATCPVCHEKANVNQN
jgi:hypothetical protein